MVVSNLSPDSPVFSFIQYYLKQSIGASSAQVCEIAEISNPQLTIQFEKRSKNMLTIDSWVDECALPESLSFEEITSKGIPQKSLAGEIKFQAGKVNTDFSAKSGKLKMRFLLCKVAIGRAFNCSPSVATTAKVPEGYDSFVVDENLAQSQETLLRFDNWVKDEGKKQSLHYYVKETAQVLPMYIVSFELDLELEKSMRDCPKCDNCEISPASLHCETDNVNLCVACDASLHTGKVGSRHVRTNMDKSTRMSSACKQHPEKLIEFYCPTCNIPVCVHCKMTGHHSSGESSRHKLVGIIEAYQSIFEASRSCDPLFEARKHEINEHIQLIQEKAKSIERNQNFIEAELEDRFKKAISEIRISVCKKFNLLKGELAELSRRQLEMTNMEDFLTYQKSGGAVLQFILDWSHFLKLKSEIHASPFPKLFITPVEPDIKIQGQLAISSGNKTVSLEDDSAALLSPTAYIQRVEFDKFYQSEQDIDKFQAILNNSEGLAKKYEETFNETLKNMKTMSLIQAQKGNTPTNAPAA